MLVSPGRRAGAYELVERTARSHGFELWEARHQSGHAVTLQLWACQRHENQRLFDEYWADQRALERGVYPEVLRSREHFELDGAPALVFETDRVVTLEGLIERQGALPTCQSARIAARVARAVAHAHELGVAHGGLDAAHVLLGCSSQERVFVFGFGGYRLSAACDVSSVRTEERTFAPPAREAVVPGAGAVPDVPSIDAWGVGALLHACLTGVGPDSAALERLRTLDGSPGEELASQPFELVVLLRELTAADPATRVTALGRAALVLERHAAGSGDVEAISVERPSSNSSPSGKPTLVDVERTTGEPSTASPSKRPRDLGLIGARFEPAGEVRVGGMGRVLRTFDRESGRFVAVKLLHTAAANPAMVTRFEREARLLASLTHPAIVEYIAHGLTEAGEPYLAMEWLEGIDLEQRISEVEVTARGASSSSALSIEEVLTLGFRLASATALLHEQGVVHRDIKPGNVFLVGGKIERCKLLDLGVARFGEAEAQLTQTGALVGTPAYMAPEQAEPKGNLGPASDVWAIGCVMYECLTGQRAFSGHNLMAVLAKIVLEAPTPIQELRPDAPVALARLIEQMLVKNPEGRLRDGRALVRAMEGLRATTGSRRGNSKAPSLADSLTMGERRFGCLLLAEPMARNIDLFSLTAEAEARGGKLAVLMNGSLLITPSRSGSMRDDAVRIAHIAEALLHVEPRLRMAMSVGQMRAGEAPPTSREAQSSAWGAAIDDVVRALAITPLGQVHVDAVTAALIEPNFALSRHAGSYHLGARREAERTRTLLGKPIAWVGRQRELMTLTSLFEEVRAEGSARAIVLTAPAGMGKTRLRAEFIQQLRRDEQSFTLLLGQGDSISAGSPFVMIAPAVRRLAEVQDAEPTEQRHARLRERLAHSVPPGELDRIAAFLGEMVGVPLPSNPDDSLRAARKDPMLMAELMRTAWIDWLGFEAAQSPVVIVLEDLHWGDAPSVRFIEAALSEHARRRLLVVALARPELDEVFPALWNRRQPERMKLRALSDSASRTLVQQALGAKVDPAIVTMIVERAEGNAFFLEELIRMVAEGAEGHLPATVLGMVQSRLDAFGVDAKRLLRAASVFGEVFWRGGLGALLGAGADAFSLDECLSGLTSAELITEHSDARVPGEKAYKFRHALLRDGAYEMLTPSDRVLGHRLAGTWLEAAGEQDAMVLAEHFARGEDSANAVRWFHRAAQQALEANDLAMVMRCEERAIACDPQGEQLGAIRSMQANAAYWQSEYEQAVSFAELALPVLTPGSALWFNSIASIIVASARLGEYDTVDRWFDAALAGTAHADARSEQLICLCRGTFQLIFNARFEQADRVLERIETLTQDVELDALTVAQANHVAGVRAAHVGDVATFLRHLEAAIDAFERAGDARNVRLETTTQAWCYAEIGDFARAEQICRSNLLHCARLNAQQAITYAKVNLGYILCHCEHAMDEAAAVLKEAIDECGVVANLRLEGWARAHLSTVEYQRRNLAESERQAALAVELLSQSPGLAAWAKSAHARVLLDLGELDRALLASREAMETLERLRGLLQGESLPPLVLAQTLHALGDAAGAENAIKDAEARLMRRVERLPAAYRRRFLALPDNRLTLELFDAWVA